MSDLLRILLVDDDRELIRGISVRLRAARYEVFAAHDGLCGLQSALEHRPDAIVLDIRMPLMDGLTMLGKLREDERTRRTPVVIVSANVNAETSKRATELDARYVLQKPYRSVDLMSAIASATAQPPTLSGNPL